MRKLEYKQLRDFLYEVSEEGSDRKWLLEEHIITGRWYVSDDEKVFIGDYESLEQAKKFLEIHINLKDFAKILPWESMANGGTK